MAVGLLYDLAIFLRLSALVGGMALYSSQPAYFLYLFEVTIIFNLLVAAIGATPTSRFARVFELVFGRFESTFLLCVVSILSKDDIRVYVLIAVAQYLSLWISVYRYFPHSKLLTKEAISLVHSPTPYPISRFSELVWFVADVSAR